MGNGPRYRTHDCFALQCGIAVGPGGDEPADRVLNPFLAACHAFALEAHLLMAVVARSMIRGISEHTLQCKRNSPAWTVKSSPSRFGS
ncbi:MAG TPA: hypothetical protein VK789_31260, partial [Bryobacteraceae bacterium]|nr:hypothetical protein [Bryobacteraceae bacterium]